MPHSILLYLTLLLTASLPATGATTYYVASTDGLNVRGAAELMAEVLAKAPFAAEMTVLDSADFSTNWTVIAGRPGRWAEVDYDGVRGYVFSAFLCRVRFTDIVEEAAFSDQYMLDYIGRFTDCFIADSVVFKSPNVASNEMIGSSISNLNFYADGSQSFYHYGYEEEYLTLITQEIDGNDLVNFFQYLQSIASRNRDTPAGTLEFRLGNFPKAHNYIVRGSYSRYNSVHFEVRYSRMEITLWLGMANETTLWPDYQPIERAVDTDVTAAFARVLPNKQILLYDSGFERLCLVIAQRAPPGGRIFVNLPPTLERSILENEITIREVYLESKIQAYDRNFVGGYDEADSDLPFTGPAIEITCTSNGRVFYLLRRHDVYFIGEPKRD